MPSHDCRWGLYLISDDASLLDGSFPALLDAALRAGLRVAQLRGKRVNENALLAMGREARRLTRRHGAALIVNDRVELAMRLEADGVHLGQGDTPPAEARRILGPGAVIGFSTHNREQVEAAQGQPVDYIGVGPVFATSTKEQADPVVGLDLVHWAVGRSRVPVVAIGGISLENLDAVLATGTPNVAVISAITRAADPAASVAEFLRRVCS